MSDNQLATRHTASSVKEFLALPSYKDRFQEVLGKRANQFMAAITAVSQLPALRDAEPKSVIAAAMVAATLDLPVNPTLGQAWVVAYAEGGGNKVAQFQIGYKGLIQLALRSGQYKRLNAGPVSASVFKGYDMVGEPVLDWSAYDPLAPTAGYFCAFETLNGFIKVVYWSKEQAEAHGKRFSRAYAKGYNTPWKTDFDSMATKTVVKAALSKWGILSVEMQKAVVHDQGVQEDVDADVKYVDGEESTPSADQPEAPKRPPAPRKAKGAATVIETTVEPAEPAPVETFAQAAAVTPSVEVAPEPAKSIPEPAKAAPEPLKPVAPQPRAFLSDKEEIEAEVKVIEAVGVYLTKGGTTHAAVKAKLKGGFNGDVYHLKGGEASGEDVILREPWKVGASLKVKLQGELSPKSGKVLAYVQAAEECQEVF